MLCVAVMLSVMVLGAGAAFSDQDQIENTEAVDACSALNIIGGYEDGSFHPERNIKRSEVTKMICVALNGGVEPNLAVPTTPTFSDVRDTSDGWAEKYIESCVAQGIVSGVGGGRFSPAGNVTGSQLAKMLLVAIGYDADLEGFTGNAWETNVNVVATQKGLYEDLESLDPSVAITRDDAAQMVWNAMQAVEVEYTYTLVSENGQLVSKVTVGNKAGDPTLLEDKYDAIIEYGYMTNVSYNEDKDEYTYTLSAAANFGAAAIPADAVTVSSLTTSIDASDLYGQQVKVIYKDDSKNTVYGIFAYDSSVLATAVVGDLPDDLDADDTSMKVDDVTYRLDAAANAITLNYYNNGDSSYNLVDFVDHVSEAYAISLIDNDDNGKVNTIVAYPFTVAQVSYVGSSTFNLDTAGSVLTPAKASSIKLEDVTYYEGMAADDYVMIVDSAYTVDGNVNYTQLTDVVEGEITATEEGAVEVDGTWYNVIEDTFKLGDTYKFVIVNGYVCYYEEIASGATIEDYAVVTDAASGANTVAGPQAKLLLADGTTITVSTDQDYSSSNKDKLVTFDEDDDEYTLTAASSDADEAGFDRVIADSDSNSTIDYVYSSGSKSTIEGYYIADDAVVFVKDGSGDYDVITGATLKKYETTGVTKVNNAYADESSDGLYYVTLAYVELSADVISAADGYGYVTSNVASVKNSDNKTVSKMTLWTANGELTDILADANVSGTVSKGSVVTYVDNGDGSYEIKLATNLTRGAVTGYNANTGIAAITTNMDKTSTPSNYEVTSDTEILGINSDSKTGVEGATIQTAVDSSTAGEYAPNVYFYYIGNELDVIVVDYDKDIPALTGTSTVTNAGNLQAALNSYTSVSFDGSGMTDASSVTVPSGTTLTVTDAHASNKLDVTLADGAALVVAEDVMLANGSAVVMAPGATVSMTFSSFNSGEPLVFGENGFMDIAGGDLTITYGNSNNIAYVAESGSTVTIRENATLALAHDTYTVSGATIVGAEEGVTINIQDESKVTGADDTNFYNDNTDATADDLATGIYKWTTFTETTGNTQVTGWLKQS